MSSINDFISQVKTDGLARTNRFSVMIPFPTSAGNTQPQKVLILCDSVTMPGIGMQTAQQRIWGEQRDFPTEFTFEDVTFTFYVDANLTVKQLFEEWMTNIRNPQTRTFNYYSNYITDIDIYVHTVADGETPIHSVTLHEAYPKSLAPITLDYSSKEVMKYSVTMNYKWYTTNNIDAALNQNANNPDNLPLQDPQAVNTGTGTSVDNLAPPQVVVNGS